MRPFTVLAAFAAMSVALPAAAQEVTIEDVKFLSRDGKTQVKGYLYKPADAPEKLPAVVMLHGRGGAYSSLAKGKYDASTLSARHKMWGQLLAKAGYAALMVDDFGPMGYPDGFGRFTYNDRPEALNEVTMRPLHAYGALRFLQSRADIIGTRVALLGWSNGGSATLAAMADDKPGDMRKIGFSVGIPIYPGCGLKNAFAKGYKPYNPVRVFMGSGDEEVSSALCERFVGRSKAKGGDITIRVFKDATHSYDTPIKSRQSVPANAAAKASTETEVLAILAEHLKQ